MIRYERGLHLVHGRLQHSESLQSFVLNVHQIVVVRHPLPFVTRAGHKCVLVERHQLVVLVPVVMVDVLVLQVLRCDVFQRLARLVAVMEVLDDRVRMLVMSYLEWYVNLDVLATDTERRDTKHNSICD